MKFAALILVHFFIRYASASNCDAVTAARIVFDKEILGVDRLCGATQITQFDEQFEAKDMVTLGVKISAHLVGMIPVIGGFASGPLKIFADLFSAFCPGGITWQQALAENYNELVHCMDAKINNYDRQQTEDIWRGFMDRFVQAIVLLRDSKGSAASVKEARDEIDDVFDEMNGQIVTDFGRKQTESQYLEAEALLPILKVLAEVYWATFTTHLSLMKAAIESGEYPAEDDPHLLYNRDLIKLAQPKLKMIQEWAQNAKQIIYNMYEPTVTVTSSYSSSDYSWVTRLNYKYTITWQKGQRSTTGNVYYCSLGAFDMERFKSEIRSKFDHFIYDVIEVEYNQLFPVLLSASYRIGSYNDDGVYQSAHAPDLNIIGQISAPLTVISGTGYNYMMVLSFAFFIVLLSACILILMSKISKISNQKSLIFEPLPKDSDSDIDADENLL